MIKWSAYTLLELIVVVAIIGLLAAFGIPAFSRYGRVTEAKQKTAELKELVTQARNLAQNPENSFVDSYRVFYDLSANPGKYALKSCRKVGIDACDTSIQIREVKLIKEQSIEVPADGDSVSDWVMDCSTTIIDGKVNCQQNPAIFSPGSSFNLSVLTDYYINISSRLIFKIYLDPFKIVDSSQAI